MKVPPKRKGNHSPGGYAAQPAQRLNESPSEKEGKSVSISLVVLAMASLNESPSEKEGKCEKCG